MIPVRTSEDVHTSKNVRGFRDIRHSTVSKRLFSDFGGTQLKVRPTLPQLDGFTFGQFKLPGGYLENQWVGQALDQAMVGVLQRLDKGGILYALVGSVLRSLYRRSRGSLIQFIVQLLYKILMTIFRTILSILWKIIITPLLFIAFLLILILLPLLL